MNQMRWVVEGRLARACRPGYSGKNVGRAAADEWIREAKTLGIKTIVCLLDDKQLGHYSQLGAGGLLAKYKDEGFQVIHRPVKDYATPPVPEVVLRRIAADFVSAELPMLVHCSAGKDRTGAVIDYLVKSAHLPEFRAMVEKTMRDHSAVRGEAHFLQVTRLALRLYDALGVRLPLDPRFRTILWAAAMLHDIGTVKNNGAQDHAWVSGARILKAGIRCRGGVVTTAEIATVAALHGIDNVTEEDPLGRLEEPVLGLWPDSNFPYEIHLLAAILRVADGLDRHLDQTVVDVAVEGHRIKVTVVPGRNATANIQRAQEKSALLSELTVRNWRVVQVSESSPEAAEDARLDEYAGGANERGRQGDPASCSRAHGPREPRPVFAFDLSGTLVDHRSERRLVPYMGAVLAAVEGDVYIVSRWDEAHTRRILEQALPPVALERVVGVIHANDKGDAVRALLGASRGHAYCIDDRPKVLGTYLRQKDDRMTCVGFLGSGNYAGPVEQEPALSAFCSEQDIPMALSAIDLIETLAALGAPVSFFKPDQALTDAEAIEALRGLLHPRSAGAGCTRCADHRPPLSLLFDRWAHNVPDVKLLHAFWEAIAWIRCSQCQWKALVWSVLLRAGHAPAEFIQDSWDKDWQFSNDLRLKGLKFLTSLRPSFEEAFVHMNRGVNAIGADARYACALKVPFEENAMEKNYAAFFRLMPK